ncbi:MULTISPECIES: carbohydrate ABC transporter permease [Streptomyces]|uniref:Sugar ABC transporter permease n=2 Tax=Streptomyces TaxID=1883 RepID=A0ABS9JMC9_9ACTN|nr:MULTISPECIES: sugar ABC transporter permease [Streptomyces]MYU30786.1 ABC transporter permease subunit [Streptomyces sp. SID7810]CUW31871.1 Lactose transport system permease protein LacF [Streptomyces reticuli]MCG0066722.1 sugar ABC transporter permease [Streptomyces tricolor]OYP14699.1 sugar ABC transporter permease [Streptomyces sp. FBKL.4005]BCM70166.1 putative ABC transporter permease protein [Streptomyces sp. EAS-AB2608]
MRKGQYRFVAGFLFVPVALYLIFVIWPYIQTFGYSLTDWKGQSQTFGFVGLDNYRKLFQDDVFVKAIWHNILFLVFIPVVTILLALFFAFMLNAGGRGRAGGVQGVAGAKFYKILYFFPQVLSLAILAVLFNAVYRSDGGGLLNGFLIKLGLVDADRPVEWLNEPNMVLWALLLVVVWHGVGFYLVLFSAAMQSIPRDIYEAALIDGASRNQSFFRITLPLLWDSVQTAWVYLGIVAMDMFVLVSSMTQNMGAYGGGPDHHSDVMSTVMMRNFLYYGKSGYACAMGVVMLLLTLVLSVVTLRATRRERIEF